MPIDYRDPSRSPEERAEALLAQMTTEEKVDQLRSELLMDWQKYDDRDFSVGHVRNVGCFLPTELCTAGEVARRINEDTRRSIAANRLGIPVLQNGEALHGAGWGRATVFPQAIGLAATFDPELIRRIGDAVAQELRAVGVRSVFAPVVNLARDCRWGRTEETYGESVLLNARMGAAYVRGLEEDGVIAAPKHFVDNYAEGGRDSNASLTSWRELEEEQLEPFAACIRAGAQSIMIAYNSVDGVPCSCNGRLMEDILRQRWGFTGFTISDYNGVDGVWERHFVTEDALHAQALCLNNGLDVDLPNGYDRLNEAVQKGLVSAEKLDEAVLRVLQAKFRLGLFERPFVDPDEADKTVLCPAHIRLAEEAAEKSLVLLKNDNGTLPLDRTHIKRLGVFGPAANEVATGGYSGRADRILTPLEALRAHLGAEVELVFDPGDTGLTAMAEKCDAVVYFAASLEGEGKDRCDIRLPDVRTAHWRDEDGGLIVDAADKSVGIDQHSALAQLFAAGRLVIVVLVTGAPVDMEDWGDRADAILQAWYPGQRGGETIARTLFGEICPSGKLPITFPRCLGQLPLHHEQKPSGRGYGYIENDGRPRYPFGFGLSYTTFALSDFSVETGTAVRVSATVRNTGSRAGDEVMQLYIHAHGGSVVRPLQQIRDICRVSLQPGEEKTVTLTLDRHACSCLDIRGEWGLYDGMIDVMLGTSASDIVFSRTLSPAELADLA